MVVPYLEAIYAAEPTSPATRPPQDVELSQAVAERFVRLRFNPHRFTRTVFQGAWQDIGRTAQLGSARFVARIDCGGGVIRDLVRQGRDLFALELGAHDDLLT